MKHTLLAFLLSASALGAAAQAMYFDSARVAPDSLPLQQEAKDIPLIQADTLAEALAQAEAADTVPPRTWVLLTEFGSVDEYMEATRSLPYDTVVSTDPLPRTFFMPAVFKEYTFEDRRGPFEADFSGQPHMRWIETANAAARAMDRMSRYLFYTVPQNVPYNINLLPEAPKRFTAVVDPRDHTIKIEEQVSLADVAPTVEAAPVRERHWLHAFNASLQFSQAYISPNWYQGGNNNLNALGNIYYNVKLNQSYHPNLLFETTAQYKLGINNAPDDKIHSYNISDDIFQVTSTFGVKAARRWYYSLSLLFKTQLLQSYKSNSHEMRAAFMSPGELNIGLGMTYNYVNSPKTITFDASISPLTYNLKTCISRHIDPAKYEIDEGRRSKNKVGSSAELKFSWKIAYNIVYTSRLFGFTDYSHAYADWENTVAFEINRFLTTQIYVHARYDTATPPSDDPGWHKLQLKEILSIGFAYKFSSI